MLINLKKQFFQKNIQYNILSLLNVLIGFIFIVILGRKMGANIYTDIYFSSLIAVGYLGLIVQSIGSAFTAYYSELKIKDQYKANKLYSTLLNNTAIVALIVIVFYFIITFSFEIINNEYKNFLNIFIFYVLFQNIHIFNKIILNLEHFYASLYLTDIFINLVNISIVYFLFDEGDITLLAISTLLGLSLAISWQFYLLFKKSDVQYIFSFRDIQAVEIYKNSLKIRIGSLLYSIKDLVLINIFTNAGEGIYTLYSYANKFALTILQIVNAPIIKIFTAKLTYVVAEKKFNQINQLIKQVIMQTLPLFLIASIILYLLLTPMLSILMNNSFSIEQINIIKEIYSILIFVSFIVLLENPYSTSVVIFKLFNYSLIVNLIHMIIFFLIYFIVTIIHIEYMQFLYVLVFLQFINLYLYHKKIIGYINDNN